MKIKGLNIKGMDMTQIGRIMESYIKDCFADCTLRVADNGLFSEVARLAHDEINHLLIQSDEQKLFNGDEWFNGASGLVDLNSSDGSLEECTAMLILDEQQEQALYLYVSRWYMANEITTLVKDFVGGVKSMR